MSAGPDVFAAVRLTFTDCRRDGAPFPLAWSRALEVVPPPAEGGTAEAVARKQTRDAPLGTRHAWQGAYERKPLEAQRVAGR